MLNRKLLPTRLLRVDSLTAKQRGWVMLETLLSLTLMAAVLTLSQQQGQSQQRLVYQFEQTAWRTFQAQQVGMLRNMKQEPDWLAFIIAEPKMAEAKIAEAKIAEAKGDAETTKCFACATNELERWVVTWLVNPHKAR
ncbi:hypothetical protein CBF23_006565 [Marinomonas agarivorans]|nr:hypothetical protein CBF23_006565 [Marinomonas agarivorans]